VKDKGLKQKTYFPVFFILCILASCSAQEGNNSGKTLLSIPVSGSKSIDYSEFNSQLMNLPSSIQKTDNLYVVLSQIFSIRRARESVISISRIDGSNFDIYAATLVFDKIPDGDSNGGHRYDLKLKSNEDDSWEIVEAKESWRCGEGRGHKDFGIEPCV
jgi:hypothetical protein